MPETPPASVGIVLFEGFEVLDVFGPVEMLAGLPDHFGIEMLGPAPGPVRSAQGVSVVAGLAYDTAPVCDIVLVPGGIGTRRLVDDAAFLDWLGTWAGRAELVTSVCTGSGVLAAAGLLEGRRATSNKRAFAWASSQGSQVEWVAEARWVEDGDRWTSSGVSAGMDMALAIVGRRCGAEVAEAVADRAEYEWHRDPSWDPFAAKNGLA